MRLYNKRIDYHQNRESIKKSIKLATIVEHVCPKWLDLYK